MHSMKRKIAWVCLVTMTLITVLPALVCAATSLIGYPYAMWTSTSTNNTRIYMFDRNGNYIGSARSTNASTSGLIAWETLRDAMYSRKMTYLFHDNGNGYNDGSTGNLIAYVVTIF